LACEQIAVQHIKENSTTYTVYFKKPPYLLGWYEYANGQSCTAGTCGSFHFNTYYEMDNTAGVGYNGGKNKAHSTNQQNGNAFRAEYYLTLSWISGPAEVSWAMSAQDTLTENQHETDSDEEFHGYSFDWKNNATLPVGPVNTGFRARFWTCDGCRWQYISDAATDGITHQIGAIYGRQNESETYLKTYPSARCTSNLAQVGGRPYAHMVFDTAEGLPRQNQAEDPTGSKGDECGTPTYREQFSQAIRPT
jgi:hypothetical protein